MLIPQPVTPTLRFIECRVLITPDSRELNFIHSSCGKRINIKKVLYKALCLDYSHKYQVSKKGKQDERQTISNPNSNHYVPARSNAVMYIKTHNLPLSIIKSVISSDTVHLCALLLVTGVFIGLAVTNG